MPAVWMMTPHCMVSMTHTHRLKNSSSDDKKQNNCYYYSWYRIPDAAITGQLRLVKMLVERGADPCFKNRKGKTPCDVAAAAVHNFLITARGELAKIHANHCRRVYGYCAADWKFTENNT